MENSGSHHTPGCMHKAAAPGAPDAPAAQTGPHRASWCAARAEAAGQASGHADGRRAAALGALRRQQQGGRGRRVRPSVPGRRGAGARPGGRAVRRGGRAARALPARPQARMFRPCRAQYQLLCSSAAARSSCTTSAGLLTNCVVCRRGRAAGSACRAWDSLLAMLCVRRRSTPAAAHCLTLPCVAQLYA